MNKEFRKLALQKIAENAGISVDAETVSVEHQNVKDNLTLAKIIKDAGILTDFVEKKLKAPADFKSKFLKLKAGPEREKLVFDEVIKRGSSTFGNMVPITVPGPGDTKITYKAMARPIIIDGFSVPMSGSTLQKIANHFGMSLPTSKIIEQIWDEAGKVGVQVAARPLSGSGVTIDGKHYSGKQVVDKLIGDSGAAVAYNEIMKEFIPKSSDVLVAGEGKTIVMTDRPEQLGLYGGRDAAGNIIQKSEHTGHNISVHAEYMTFGRLLAGNVTVTLPNGKIIETTMDKLLDHPEMHKAISKTKVQKYKV